MQYDEKILNRIVNILLLSSSNIHDLGLYSGKMGIAIFFAHYSRHVNNDLYLDYAYSLIDEIYEEIHSVSHFCLDYGFSGIGYGITYLVGNGFFLGDLNEILYDLDLELMMFDPKRIRMISFDYGFAGLVYYLLTRINCSYISDKCAFDITYLKEIENAIIQFRDGSLDVNVNRIFDLFLKCMKGCYTTPSSFQLPRSIKEKLIVLDGDFLNRPLGLKGGLAGYGLKMIQYDTCLFSE